MDPKRELQRIQEQLWVLQAQQRDQEAFRSLVDLYGRRLLYYVRRLLAGDDCAVDAVQEVWLTVFRRIGSLQAPEAFRVWLYKIAHDQAVSVLRRQRRAQEVHQDFAEQNEATDPCDEMGLLEQAELVHLALDQISPLHRDVLTLRFLEDLSLEEIAKVVGCTLGTAKSRLHYGRHALRQKIEEMSHD